MNYTNGLTVQLGDRVLIEQGRTQGWVREIIETNGEMRNFNVEEAGLMIESAPFGLVFWPTSFPDAIVFVSRTLSG